MPTTSNPVLQPNDLVYVIERKNGQIPQFFRGTVLYIEWDNSAGYRYTISSPDGIVVIPESLYGTQSDKWMHTSYNTARSIFRAAIDLLYP